MPIVARKSTLLHTRDADAVALTTLLRAPAAVIAGAYVVGLIVGESARPLSADPLSLGFYTCAALVLLPFVLPSRWFDRVPAVLNAWLIAGAVVATARAAFMGGWLFPRLPLQSWLVKLAFDLVVVAALWLAALATRHSSIGNARSSIDAPQSNRQSAAGNQH